MVLQEMHLQRSTSLAQVYADWEHTQQLLRDIQALLNHIPAHKVSILLENAVMRRLLHTDQPTIKEVYHSIDAEALRVGYSEIGQPANPAEVQDVLNIISKPWPSAGDTPPPTVTIEGDELRCGAFRTKLVEPAQKLLVVALQKYIANSALHYVARCAIRYACIFAKTRHIGPPQCVYDDFYAWGVRNEGFASPFNARLLGKENARFFSAFPDTDSPFGSQGSLFNAKRSDYDGAWCLDPPFIPETMRRVVQRITEWRAEEGCPAILLIVPASFVPALAPDETVLLRANHHYYTGLDGEYRKLPVDVAIHRFGELPGFDAETIQQGYLP
ncbi:MAG: hypothetical protein VX278_22250 [Myxococcota bacterium]|nr:hypothetical protein [Myxococcota bacterium]